MNAALKTIKGATIRENATAIIATKGNRELHLITKTPEDRMYALGLLRDLDFGRIYRAGFATPGLKNVRAIRVTARDISNSVSPARPR